MEIEVATSEMLNISTCLPEGSILGALLFIIYINGFAKASQKFNFNLMYAGDATLSSTLNEFSVCEKILIGCLNKPFFNKF